jgi:hypothetical protein
MGIFGGEIFLSEMVYVSSTPHVARPFASAQAHPA